MIEDGVKLTTYFGERDRTQGRLLADALLELYGTERIHASVLLRGITGFGSKHQLRTDRLLTLSEDLPVAAVAVDSRERIEAIRARVQRLVPARGGLVTIERAKLLSEPSIGGPALAKSSSVPDRAADESAKLTIYVGRAQRTGRAPTFVALCDAMYRGGLSGATVLLGVDGTTHGRRQRARFFSFNAGVPAMVIAVGPSSQLGELLPELAELLRTPLMTLEHVRVCKRDGRLLAQPHTPNTLAERDPAVRQKLTVYSSESALHDGRPLHVSLIHQLRRAGAAGATSLRGVWGFHGDHAPHGDELLQTRRRTPVVTVIVDEPGRIAAAFEIVDELTAEAGLVTSEFVELGGRTGLV